MQRTDRTKGFYREAIEAISPELREEHQDRLVSEVLAYAYGNSPAFREKLDAAGVEPAQIRTYKDLEGVPTTRKDEIIEAQRKSPPFGSFLAVPIGDLERIHVSPGPVFHPRLPDPRNRDIRVRSLFAMGFRPGDIVQNCFAYHLVTAGIELDEALRFLGCIVVPAGGGSAELQVSIMQKLGVSGYMGTPSFLSLLADKAEESGLSLRDDLSLEVAFCGAEMFTEVARKRLEERWDMPILQAYGTAEAGLLGYECWCKSGFHIPEERVIEILDPFTGERLGPGEAGEVVVSSLDRALPVVRLATGDLSAMATEPCGCGRTSPRLIRILGRASESTKVRGMFVYPKQVEEVVSKFTEVANWQVVVSRERDQDSMILRVEVSDSERSGDLQQRLAERFKDVINLRADVEAVPPGSIPKDDKRLLDQRTWH